MGHVTSSEQGLSSTRGKSLGTRLPYHVHWHVHLPPPQAVRWAQCSAIAIYIDQNFKNERATISQDNCTKCKDFTIEMAEVKLELAMLWALVNTKQTTSLKNVSTQTVNDPPKKQPEPELPSEGQALPRSHISKSRTDFENQLNSYRSANKEKFEIQNARQVKKQVKNQEKTEKKSKWLQNNELANVKYKLREAEPKNKILKDDLTQALSTKEDKEDHRPWQVIKPKSTIDIRSKNKSNSNSPTTESPQLSTTNQFSMIDDQLTPTPMIINVDNDEHANETCAIDFKGDESPVLRRNERIVQINLQAIKNMTTRKSTTHQIIPLLLLVIPC